MQSKTGLRIETIFGGLLFFLLSNINSVSAFCPNGGIGTIKDLPSSQRSTPPPPPAPPLTNTPSPTSKPVASAPRITAPPTPSPAASAQTAKTKEESPETASNSEAVLRGQQLEIASSAWEFWWRANQDKFLILRDTYGFEKTENTDKDAIMLTTKEYKQLWDFFVSTLQNKDVDMRYPAVIALAKTHDKFAADEIGKFWDSGDRDVLDSVVIGVGLLQDSSQAEKLISILTDAGRHKVTRGFAAFALGYINYKPAIDVFKKIVSDANQDWEVQCSCEMTMGIMKDSNCVEFLSETLNSSKNEKINNSVRAYAALSLGRIGGEISEAPLRRALEDPNEDVRRCAVIAVGQAGYKSCKDILVKIMQSDKDLITTCFAAISIGELGDETAYEALVKELHSANSIEIQGFAAIGLGLLGNKFTGAVKPLREIAGNARELESLRCAAILALGMLKDKASLELFLREAEKKQFPKLRKYVILSMGLIGENDKNAIKTIKEIMNDSKKRDLEVYKYCVYALILLGEQKTAFKQLKDDLESGNIDLKLAVLDAIGRAGDYSLTEPLMTFFKTEKQKIVRQFCLGTFGRLVDRNFKSPLLKNIIQNNNYYMELLVINHVLYIP
ncbi:MAG: HEAT repeat domain-containing protein [Planctomycetes bacterium]|nr:HEAT repeat domain-containing protein [Planctomycetota bacterium]